MPRYGVPRCGGSGLAEAIQVDDIGRGVWLAAVRLRWRLVAGGVVPGLDIIEAQHDFVALVVVGFWKHSPISLAKIASMMAGYFPDPSSGLAIYLLVLGFLLTSFLFGRNIYCQYVCPFNAAQRLVGLIGGASIKLPAWVVQTAERIRNLLVFAAIFLAFLTLKPALASYEPFAALFSLTGTTLQWLLLFIILTLSLVIITPFCNLFCPMRTLEKTIQDIRGMFRKPRRTETNG